MLDLFDCDELPVADTTDIDRSIGPSTESMGVGEVLGGSLDGFVGVEGNVE